MLFEIGVLAAFGAALSWALGDFFIQRSVRDVGDVEALFFICAFAAVALPLVGWQEILEIAARLDAVLFLAFLGFVDFVGSMMLFEAYKRGKLSVVEPVLALELPVTVAFGIFLVGEHFTGWQSALVLGIVAGLLLVSVKRDSLQGILSLEPGVLFMLGGAVLMGVTNYLVFEGVQGMGALGLNWFVFSFVGIYAALFLAARKKLHLLADLRHYWRDLVGESFFDTAAWVLYATALAYLPLSIVSPIVEPYAVLAVLLGIVVGREKTTHWQKLGIALAIGGAVAMSLTA